MKKESSLRIGCGIPLVIMLAVILTIVSVTLKLCNVIDWSWWWVISPGLIYIAICLLLVIIVAIFIKFID